MSQQNIASQPQRFGHSFVGTTVVQLELWTMLSKASWCVGKRFVLLIQLLYASCAVLTNEYAMLH